MVSGDLAREFSVSTAAAGDAFIVAVSGQADLHTAPEVRDVIGTAIDHGQRHLVIDLTETTFIDSMTLGVLLSALKRLNGVDGKLAIICPDQHLRRVFEITSLDRIFALTQTRDDALERVREPDAA